MMISTIHRRTHQIYRTRIHTNVFFVGVLFVDCLCYQTAIRSHHKTAKFCVDRHITHACRNQNLIVYFLHAFSDHADVIWLLIRAIRDTDTTGKIDKSDVYTNFFFQAYCQFEQFLSQQRIIIICDRIACQKCMDTKLFHTFCFHDTECFEDLFCCHTVFGVARVIHDVIADLKDSSRIVAAAHLFRQLSNSFLHFFNVRDIIQVDDTVQRCCISKLLFRCIVGRKHNVISGCTDRFGEHQLCHGRTVAATAVFS